MIEQPAASLNPGDDIRVTLGDTPLGDPAVNGGNDNSPDTQSQPDLGPDSDENLSSDSDVRTVDADRVIGTT